jgi:AmmeMemoRadiSam system protein B
MSLVFAGISPHPPLLLPTIGKDALRKVEKTATALKRLEEDLYLAKPDVAIIISPHGKLLPDAFTVNFCDQFETDFKQFGDLSTKLKFGGDSLLASRILHESKQIPLPTKMISVPKLDHGVGVPLFCLAPHLPALKIIPVGFSDLDLKTHLEFGQMIKELCLHTTQRIAVIASADLSHALTNDAPAGFNANGKKFDASMQELLAAHNTTGLVQLERAFTDTAAECGLRSILILLGVLTGVHYTYEAYAYEGPFGVGYLTANFVL